MQATRPVTNIFFVVLFLGSIGGNAAAPALEKANYSIIDYSHSHYYRKVKKIDSERHTLNAHNILILESTFTCWFEFQCTSGCQCNLASTNIT